MNSQVGIVVVLKNIIFKRTHFKDKRTIDHAYGGGRPAIIICETEDKVYHLLLTHGAYEDEHKDGRYYPIVDFKNSDNNDSFIDFSEIHSRPLCYEKEVAYIEDEDLRDILVAFCTYQENVFEDEEYEEIRPYVYNLIRNLSLEDTNCAEKIKK